MTKKTKCFFIVFYVHQISFNFFTISYKSKFDSMLKPNVPILFC